MLYFPLFSGMVIYDNEFETKENKIWTKDKIELQHRHSSVVVSMSNIQLRGPDFKHWWWHCFFRNQAT